MTFLSARPTGCRNRLHFRWLSITPEAIVIIRVRIEKNIPKNNSCEICTLVQFLVIKSQLVSILQTINQWPCMAVRLINQCATRLWIGDATGRWQGFIQILNIYINEFKKGFQELVFSGAQEVKLI
jgi:hypothetical protein